MNNTERRRRSGVKARRYLRGLNAEALEGIETLVRRLMATDLFLRGYRIEALALRLRRETTSGDAEQFIRESSREALRRRRA